MALTLTDDQINRFWTWIRFITICVCCLLLAYQCVKVELSLQEIKTLVQDFSQPALDISAESGLRSPVGGRR